MWNPFKKKTVSNLEQEDVNMPNAGFFQRLMLKKFMAMSDEQKQQMAQEFMKPENIAKNRDKILASIEQMEKGGLVTKEQAKEARRRFNL